MPLLVYFLIVAVSYIGYSLIRGRIPDKIKSYVLARSFIFLFATLVGGFLISNPELKQSLFTFSAVYLGFWLNEKVKFQEERRKLKFFLGVLWQELRYNRGILGTVKVNYNFFLNEERDLEIMFLKFSSINTHAGFLKSTVYDSFISSTVMTGLKRDDVFNDLADAYTNIRFLQSSLGIVLTDFDIKLKIHRHALEKNGKNKYTDQIIKDLSKKIVDNSGKELAISYRSVCKAIDTVNDYLNTMVVKTTEEKRADADLTNEDEKFLGQILQKTPEKIPEQLFED